MSSLLPQFQNPADSDGFKVAPRPLSEMFIHVYVIKNVASFVNIGMLMEVVLHLFMDVLYIDGFLTKRCYFHQFDVNCY